MFKDKRILVTGGTGSWGHELVKQLLEQDPKEICIYSRNELAQVKMEREFNDKRLKFIIGDVRDYERMNEATRGIDYIFHLAALKHVPICELQPYEAIKTNIIGTENLIKAAINNKVKKVIEMIMTTIPYPIILEVICQDELLLAVGDSMINQNDTSKNVLKEVIMTTWLNTSNLNSKEQAFLESINISNLSSRNLYKLYQDLTGHLVRLNASLLTEEYIGEVDTNIVKEQYDVIETLNKEIEGLKSKIKKESQFNKRLELNVQIKRLEQQKEKMIAELQGGK